VELNDLHGPYRRLAEDVREGLSAERKTLPPKYFYDQRGSELFEQITRLPEYYQTRTEGRMLSEIADQLVRQTAPRSLVEIGSGSSSKTRIILDALQRAGMLDTYVPVDVSQSMLEETAVALEAEYDGLRVDGLVHDFEAHLDVLPGQGPHLLLFLGSTIGNLDAEASRRFLRNVAEVMAEGDHFLLGTDLVKDPALLEAAYNDAQGVTALFNKNVLAVLNRELGAKFDLDRFEHRSVYNEQESRIEMHLVSDRRQDVKIAGLGLTVPFEEGQTILTEISCKYTEEGVRGMLAEVGLELVQWITDPSRYFGLSLSRSTGG
jgi:L-histidine N-alpha-methyltransferase